MANYPQHLRLLLLLSLLLLCPWLALGLVQEQQQAAPREQLDALHRSKRTLTTICVEIKPSGPQEEPYFMCKGTDFSRGGAPAQPAAEQQQKQQQQQQQQQQPIQTYQQTEQQTRPINPQYIQTPFPSFPSFGAGFFPIASNYDEPPAKATPATTYSNQTPATESHVGNFGPAAAAAYAPATAPQPYGVPAVHYPGAGGAPAAARGNAAGARPASAAPAYADAAAPKSPSAAQGASLPKPQSASGQASHGNGNAYDSLVGSRYHVGIGEDVLAVPDVGFRQEELNLPYRQPVAGRDAMVGVAPPMVWMPLMQTQLQQPTAAAQPPPYYDDPIMRTFYASLEPNEPQLGQAAPLQQATPVELSGYSPSYPQPAAAPAAPMPPQMTPPSQPNYNANPKTTSALTYSPAPPGDSNVCNSCPCPTSADSTASYNTPAQCPSFQPVIIAMPCYGQQQPTHYLAVPGSGSAAAARDPMVGSSFGAPFGLGSPFGLNQQVAPSFGLSAPQVGSGFGLGAHAGAAYGIGGPQVGSSFGMAPQVGAPFGMAPVLNPFGPFGSLNPFNPFNRLLGAPVPTTQQPRLRLFGAPEESTMGTATTAALPKVFGLSFPSTTTRAPTTKGGMQTTESVVAATRDGGKKEDADEAEDEEEDEEEENDSHDNTEAPKSAEDVETEASKSTDPDSDLNAEQLIVKGEEKLKSDKRKRQNFRSKTSHKRKYLQRL
ncbi:hypothetical protein AWZ03_006357 [Drosophila navojoa]|uniref:VM domain-containing protein n=1 Tax=Drosophila navojoa TaxID=7232 RepID=A0A484BEF0_DRONA|nr:trithorax group protein osa [Drosophila navojoa]TDG47226.1 hypothetical protein AWZ03_006357 [Drosophila navojoa]